MNAKQRRDARRSTTPSLPLRDALLMSVAATEAENALKAKMAPIIAQMQSDLDDLRLALKYVLFDNECLRREIAELED